MNVAVARCSSQSFNRILVKVKLNLNFLVAQLPRSKMLTRQNVDGALPQTT